ncbi:M23 family metallopeptidase [Desulfosporosinus lacus]|uniref:Peptidase family M23 n=1 Tax=Desulfosporosinus lacus DSM 15449 TaxID=1121420 RepID=A0A1M5R593_9FIRM|nr:M23 family metallopeptidase [Desulfosporosinus lacus]SHH21159.1 Peptidase family M23 [Desulfosporosinus lacus DSM 15449]
MKRWHIAKDWVLVWGFAFILAGLILYIGYLSSGAEISIEKPQKLTNESAHAVSASPAIKTEKNNGANGVSVTESEQMMTNSLNQDPELQEEIKLVLGEKNLVNASIGIKDFPSPVNGKPIRNVGNYYSKAFGNYVYHAGLDYALSEGTMIRATHGGTVIEAGPDPIQGQKVTLDCGEGWIITYGGLDNLRVQEGEFIETQGALGQVGLFPGSEGESDQPQLHYELWHNGQVQRIVP